MRVLPTSPGAFHGISPMRLSLAAALCALTVILFTLNAGRLAFLGDDAFISFRYAHNLVEGHGLVWNPGERVEGYTNFLWVMIMAAGMLVKIRPETLSNVIGIASGAAVLVLLVRLSARRAGWWHPLVWLAPLLLAASRSFTAWSTGGLATMFFTLLVFGALIRFADERRAGDSRPVASSLLLALAFLTRPEGYIFATAAGLTFVVDLARRRRRLRAFLVWLLPLVVIGGAHLIWRHAYYGYWLPNSFYAKVSGFWGAQAARYLSTFNADYKVLAFAPLALLPLISGRRFIHGLFLTAIALYLAYVVYVGGDRFEFRLMVPLFPFFYWLLAEGIRAVASLGSMRWRLSRVAQGAGVGLAAVLFTTTYLGSLRPEARTTRYDIAGLDEIKAYAARRIAEGKFLREVVDRGLLPRDLVLCVTGAGAVPYYTGLPTLDLYGMNDEHIAHLRITKRGVIAHEKRGSPDYMRLRGVELFDGGNKLVYDTPFRNDARNDNRGTWKSIRVGRYYLNFVTFLPESRYEERFGKLLAAGNLDIPFEGAAD